jgi:hypothetical protein
MIFSQDLLMGKTLSALSKASCNFCACLLAHIRPIYKLLLVADRQQAGRSLSNAIPRCLSLVFNLRQCLFLIGKYTIPCAKWIVVRMCWKSLFVCDCHTRMLVFRDRISVTVKKHSHICLFLQSWICSELLTYTTILKCCRNITWP